jgi:hypothetical protein
MRKALLKSRALGRGLHGLDGSVQGLHEIRQVFFENNDLVAFKIFFAVFFAFDNIQKNIAVPVFFDIEKVRPFF